MVKRGKFGKRESKREFEKKKFDNQLILEIASEIQKVVKKHPSYIKLVSSALSKLSGQLLLYVQQKIKDYHTPMSIEEFKEKVKEISRIVAEQKQLIIPEIEIELYNKVIKKFSPRVLKKWEISSADKTLIAETAESILDISQGIPVEDLPICYRMAEELRKKVKSAKVISTVTELLKGGLSLISELNDGRKSLLDLLRRRRKTGTFYGTKLLADSLDYFSPDVHWNIKEINNLFERYLSVLFTAADLLKTKLLHDITYHIRRIFSDEEIATVIKSHANLTSKIFGDVIANGRVVESEIEMWDELIFEFLYRGGYGGSIADYIVDSLKRKILKPLRLYSPTSRTEITARIAAEAIVRVKQTMKKWDSYGEFADEILLSFYKLLLQANLKLEEIASTKEEKLIYRKDHPTEEFEKVFEEKFEKKFDNLDIL